MKAIVE